jgi:hypothetical protein
MRTARLFPHLAICRFIMTVLDIRLSVYILGIHDAARNLPGAALASNTIPACSRIQASIFSWCTRQQVRRAHGVMHFGRGAWLVAHDLRHHPGGHL